MSRTGPPRPGDRAPELRGTTPAGDGFDLANPARTVLIEFHRGTW